MQICEISERFCSNRSIQSTRRQTVEYIGRAVVLYWRWVGLNFWPLAWSARVTNWAIYTGKRGAQQLAYTINSYKADQLTCLTINGIYQDAAAVHMGKLMWDLLIDWLINWLIYRSIVSKPNVKAVSELFINCMVTDSPTDWLPKIPHIFTGVTHVSLID